MCVNFKPINDQRKAKRHGYLLKSIKMPMLAKWAPVGVTI